MRPHHFGQPGRSCHGTGTDGRFRQGTLAGDRDRSELAMSKRKDQAIVLRTTQAAEKRLETTWVDMQREKQQKENRQVWSSTS